MTARVLGDREVMALNNDIYNGFWRKYRDHVPPPQSDGWEKIVDEARQLARKYGCHPMAVHQIQDYLDQMEGRALEKNRGGKG